MKKQSDPVTRIRSTYWQESKETQQRVPRDDAAYAKGYAEVIDRKGEMGFPTGDMADQDARDLCVEIIGMITAIVDNVSDDTTVRVMSLIGAVFNEQHLLRRDIAVRIAHAQWGDEGARLTRLLSDDDAASQERMEAALQLQAMTIKRMQEEMGEDA
jgi:hypothetical protein